MEDFAQLATFLFTDIEASTRLWEEEPERMREAMARHDALAREAVVAHGGQVVKMTGDGLHAIFGDAVDALHASVRLQTGLAELERECGIPIRARCGMHAGAFERRDGDYYGTAVNRAARIMAAAHGGQALVSQAVASLVAGRLPPGVELVDLGPARLRDLPRSEQLFQVAHPALRAQFPPLRGLEAPPTNLPHALTSFVGRERELAELQALIGARRLVTVTGMGGLGKTRLTLEVARRLRETFPDGVWFVALAPLTDPRWVAQAVASALGVKEDAGRPVIEALARELREREALIVLDNCEHVIDACAELAGRLLAASPGTKVLASSREALRVEGEAAFPIASLSAEGDAARLFVERASAALPAFRADAANASAIATICARLDGIPLALELAAARVRTLGVQAIAERLDDRFDLLASGERNRLPRQQTLRALIDWSYDLLTEPERALFRALAVFAGSWPLEAAEAIVDRGGGEPVAELLGRLVEKSLVTLDPESGRYSFLETVRAYALEKLEGLSEGEAVRERHLAFYLALAEAAKPQLVGPAQAEWLARFDLERENLLAAHAACLGRKGGGAAGLRLLNAAKQYWFNRGLLELAHRLAMEALARAPERDATRIRGLFDAGQLRLVMGQYGPARAVLEESLGIARETGDEKAVAALLQPLGLAALGEGDTATARLHLEAALALARRRGEGREIGAALGALGQLHRAEGRTEAAEPLYEEALAVARELHDGESMAVGLLNIAMVAILRGSGKPVATLLLEALALAEDLGSRRATKSLLETCAGFAGEEHDWDEAARLYGAAETLARSTGLRRDAADEAFLAPRIEAARRAVGPAAFAAREAEGAGAAHEETLARLRAWLGRCGAGAARLSPEATCR